MQLGNIFIGFRNHSFEEIIKLNRAGELSGKEKLLLISICENATNEINELIKESNASKSLNENDFDWSMKLYIFICMQIFIDIFDYIEKTDDQRIKTLQSIDKQGLVQKMKRIFGGADINLYVDKAYKVIEETNKEAKNYEDFIIGRTHIIFKMLNENKVGVKELSKENILSTAEKNYQNSVVNFVKICI